MIYGRVAAPWHRTVRAKGRGKEVEKREEVEEREGEVKKRERVT